MLAAEYDLWTMLYETCLRLYSRHSVCREQEMLEIDQILSTQIRDEEFQNFMMKNVLQDDVSLSSVNFYLKNTKKDYRDELKSLVMSKMNNIA